MAQEKATREEVEAKVKEAARLVREKGVEEAVKVIADKNGPFVWKDTYVFAVDLDTRKVVAHPIIPALVGRELMGVKDVDGKMFHIEFLDIGRTKGEGWVDYTWPKPGERTPSRKSTYVYRAPGTNLILLAGIYED
jgi:signal transduction histidine kinase